jgi:hypothetical protein
MTLMLAKTYAALRSAGVSYAEARAAAEEIAAYEDQLARIETSLVVLKLMVAGLGVGSGWRPCENSLP